jgi:AraC-like DNA-binding protein
MALYLINGERLLVNFQTDNNSIVTYPRFPGSHTRSFRNEYATLLLKEVISDVFSIRYKIFQFSKKQQLESSSEAIGFHSRVMIQNELEFSIEAIGPMYQRNGTVSLFSGRIANCKATMEAGIEYRALDVYAGKDLCSQLSFFFPEIQFDSERIRNLFPLPSFITPSIQKVIGEILECPYDERTSNFYFDVKVREYFYLLLQDYIAANKKRHRLTSYELDKLSLAKEILLSDLTQPPLTIRQLAKAAGINEFKLKVGFTEIFHTGVFECFQRARMYKARELLLQTNKPIKEICTLAGYPRMTNFITAFRKFFGYTPGSLRRS